MPENQFNCVCIAKQPDYFNWKAQPQAQSILKPIKPKKTAAPVKAVKNSILEYILGAFSAPFGCGLGAEQVLNQPRPGDGGTREGRIDFKTDSNKDTSRPDFKADFKPDQPPLDLNIQCKTIDDDSKLTKGIQTNLDNWALPGHLLPKRKWDFCYHASSLQLPASPFTLDNPAAAKAPENTADPLTNEPALLFDSKTPNINEMLRYQWLNPGIKSSSGLAFLLRGRQAASDYSITSGDGMESSFQIMEMIKGVKNFGFALGLIGTGIVERQTGKKYTGLDTKNSSQSFIGIVKGTQWDVYSIEDPITPLISGNKDSEAGDFLEINIGDNSSNVDATLYINDFCVHNSPSVPLESGNYERIFDLADTAKNAKLTYSGKDIKTEAFTSSDQSIWTSATIGTNGEINPGSGFQYLKIIFNLNSTASKLDSYKLDYCTWQ